jgi:uncharacterized protein (TIGR02231 family)
MFRSAFSVFALIVAYPAFAADISATSEVSAATVYPQGAQVTRTVTFSMQAGENRIIIDDLPLDIDPSTLRVAGAGSAEFAIVSVDHRTAGLPPTPEAENAAKLRIEGEIEVLNGQIRKLELDNRLLQSDIAAANARLRFAEELMMRQPQPMVDDVEYTRAGPETWAQAIELVATQTATAQRKIAETQAKIDDNSRAMEKVYEQISIKEQELDVVNYPVVDRSVATVDVASDAAVEGTLTLTYQIWNAGWQPVYDLRLDQGASAKLSIERLARVTQMTGEDWTDVALTLSTARPSGRMDTPDLVAMGAFISDPVVYATDVAGAVAPAASAPVMEDMAREMNAVQEAMLGGGFAEMDARTVEAVPQLQGQTVVYELPAKADVSGDGVVRQLTIDAADIDAKLLARATPVLDTNAYLYATLTNGFSGPLLPGPTSVFRDGVYVGQGAMPFIAQGKEVILPFGVLDGLTVKRNVLERTDGDSGILTTSNDRAERFELSIESVLTYAIPVTLYDRVPYSEQEDLEITVDYLPEPSVKDVDGKRGVINWTFMLEPGQKQVVEFGYDLSWPEDKHLEIRG